METLEDLSQVLPNTVVLKCQSSEDINTDVFQCSLLLLAFFLLDTNDLRTYSDL